MSENNSNHPNSAATLISPSLTGVWKADPSSSSLAFSVGQMFVGRLRGRFTDFEVTTIAREDPRESSVTASIGLKSVSTGNATRDHHVRSVGYFDAEKYPVAGYRSTGILSDGDGWLIDGELTLHGVTLPLRLAVAVSGSVEEAQNTSRARFTATGEFSRRDFGISTGIPIVGDRVCLSIALEVAHE